MTRFVKMNGSGNDFVIIDSRLDNLQMTPKLASWLANRRLGIGSDQVIVLEDSKQADVFMRIYNADGSESGACGNAARCVASLLMNSKNELAIETKAGVLEAKRAGADEIAVNMGEPSLSWNKIPLAQEEDCLALPITRGALKEPVAVSMGNPHMIFFAPDISRINIADFADLEHHPLFPERANVSIVTVKTPHHLVMKTWERGVGKTLSCGTAACAALVAAVSLEQAGPKALVEQPGGKLSIEWQQNGEIIMTGKVAKVFSGEFYHE